VTASKCEICDHQFTFRRIRYVYIYSHRDERDVRTWLVDYPITAPMPFVANACRWCFDRWLDGYWGPADFRQAFSRV
jgi:hypothetical protein